MYQTNKINMKTWQTKEQRKEREKEKKKEGEKDKWNKEKSTNKTKYNQAENRHQNHFYGTNYRIMVFLITFDSEKRAEFECFKMV